MNYKVGIDDPSDLDIPVDCDVYTAKQMRDFHDMNKVRCKPNKAKPDFFDMNKGGCKHGQIHNILS